jgi:hypothetical protein
MGVADVYDATDDCLPNYNCSDVGGYYLAIGTSGNQFNNAPIAGQRSLCTQLRLFQLGLPLAQAAKSGYGGNSIENPGDTIWPGRHNKTPP